MPMSNTPPSQTQNPQTSSNTEPYFPSSSISELIPMDAIPTKQLYIVEDGVEIQQTKSYGVGIDCHSKFIQVSVIIKRDLRTFEYRREFGTDWLSLTESKDWILMIIFSFSSPSVNMSIPLHYCIESTSTYHIPVIIALGGTPCIVNPVIAGATKRKTDVLDAKMLALHNLTGVWPESFIPSVAVQELRLRIAERNNYKRMGSRVSNHINNGILRFGFTVGRDGSVTRSKIVRAIVEDQLSDEPSGSWSNICLNGIPPDIWQSFIEQYNQYDHLRELEKGFKQQLIVKAKSMEWETKDGLRSGDELFSIITSVPGVGEVTVAVWLANIITPLLFPNSNALAAYCGLDPSLKISAKKVTSTVKRGGHKDLHAALFMCASVLIKNHNGMFGKWGFTLHKQTGRWKKATIAVARKLAVALYYMHMNAVEFSYDQYNLIKETIVIDITLDELTALNNAFKIYVRILTENGISSTTDLINQYYACQLKNYKGLGKKFYGLVEDFITNQNQYHQLYYGQEE